MEHEMCLAHLRLCFSRLRAFQLNTLKPTFGAVMGCLDTIEYIFVTTVHLQHFPKTNALGVHEDR